MNLSNLARLGVVLVLVGGCGDSNGGTVSASNSDGNGDTTAATEATSGPTEASGTVSESATEAADGGNSNSMSGTTGAEGGMSESLSNGEGSSPDSISGSGTSGETGNISGGGDTSASTGAESTGETPIVCTEIDNQQDCLAAGCSAITGQQFGGDEADACLEATEFLACMDPAGCADVITTVCDGDDQYMLPSSCAPEGWLPCEPPPDAGMNGYKDC